MEKQFTNSKELMEHMEEAMNKNDLKEIFHSNNDTISYTRIEERPNDYIEHYNIIVSASILPNKKYLMHLLATKEVFNNQNVYTFYTVNHLRVDRL